MGELDTVKRFQTDDYIINLIINQKLNWSNNW